MSLGGAVSEPEGQKGKKQVKNGFGLLFYIALLYTFFKFIGLEAVNAVYKTTKKYRRLPDFLSLKQNNQPTKNKQKRTPQKTSSLC